MLAVRLCSRGCGVGDQAATDLATEAHEGVAKAAGGMRPLVRLTLRPGVPNNSTGVYEGLIVDGRRTRPIHDNQPRAAARRSFRQRRRLAYFRRLVVEGEQEGETCRGLHRLGLAERGTSGSYGSAAQPSHGVDGADGPSREKPRRRLRNDRVDARFVGALLRLTQGLVKAVLPCFLLGAS